MILAKISSWLRRFASGSEIAQGTAAFLDSNVILEGRPLETLPWEEIDSAGPIHLYFVPQVLVEIDKKKQDGRLQLIARNFNRAIGPLATNKVEEIVLVEQPIRVVARLALPTRIEWAGLGGFDRMDGDALFIAEAVHSPTPPGLRRVVVSNDLNPLLKASRHGFDTVHVEHTWCDLPNASKPKRRPREHRKS